MNWCDERLGLGGEPFPDEEEFAARLASLTPAELVRAWREVSGSGLKDRTEGVYVMLIFFDGLAHDDPVRTLLFIDALLETEPDDAIVALTAQGKLLGQLLHFHARRVARPLQEMALRRPRLRWLLGALAGAIDGGMVEDPELKRRLLAISDAPGYQAWRNRRRSARPATDFATLPVGELAPLWVEIAARSDLDKEKDEDASALFDFQWDLVRAEPFKALDLVRAVLEIEDNPNVQALLAAGMLEDLIPAEDGPIVDAIVAEAAVNPRFRHLLGGVWFSGKSPEVAARLEKAREGVRW